MSNRVYDRTGVARRALAAGALLVSLGACASGQPHVALEPGVQRGDAVVDRQAGTVTLEEQGVVVSAQGAMLPAPRDGTLHPTFWVTVQNNREERITVRPTDARLVDTFGHQLEPVPMIVDRGGREVRYARVDPEIRTYISLHYGWPYYPLHPYPGWFAHPRYDRLRYWRPHPFWTFGFGPVWITEVRPGAARMPAAPVRDELEVIYGDAKLTYVVIFPELDRAARDMRLIIPEIGVRISEGGEETLEFDLVFEQIHDAEHR